MEMRHISSSMSPGLKENHGQRGLFFSWPQTNNSAVDIVDPTAVNKQNKNQHVIEVSMMRFVIPHTLR